MTARDLTLRRSTDDRGNTLWQPSPLTLAALQGGRSPQACVFCSNFFPSSKESFTPSHPPASPSPGLAILDGIHRLSPGALAGAVGRLLCDREAVLPDGTRIVQQAGVDIHLSGIACRLSRVLSSRSLV